MDMWKAFRNSTHCHAPQAAILFDKFHVVRHLSDALDVVRRSEYKRVTGDGKSVPVLLGRLDALDWHGGLEGCSQRNSMPGYDGR